MNQWQTISDPDDYTLSVNGGPAQVGRTVNEIGTYNALMKQCKAYTDLEGRLSIFQFVNIVKRIYGQFRISLMIRID